MQVEILLHNIRSIQNIGAILRSADGFGAKKVYFSGYTALAGEELPHLREKLIERIHKTAIGAEKSVETVGWGKEFSIVLENIIMLKKQGYLVVGLENNIDKKTIMVYNLNMELHKRCVDRILIVLGEEVNGISKPLIEAIDMFVEIPMFGKKESLNVSVAAGVMMYELSKNLLENN